MTDTKLVLDAEYRELIRSLHSETIKTVAAVERWWMKECFLAIPFDETDDESAPDSDAPSVVAEDRWRNEVQPALSILVHGHPDPDVRTAADVLESRLGVMTLYLDARRRNRSEDEVTVAVHLAHDGVSRLRRAAYRAPFRIERPEPTYEGISTGRAEPLPGKMLKMIQQLQDAGALTAGDPIFGGGIPAAVKQLSDIFFMPENERDALLKGMDVEVPAADESGSERDAPGFGFVRR